MRRLHILASAVTMVALLGCGGPGKRTGPPEQPVGHQRMVELLSQVAVEARDDNPYLGERRIREFEARLAALPEEPQTAKHWLLHKELGRMALRLGRTDEALAHYARTYDLLQRFADQMPQDKQSETLFEIGVAHMRQGETENCALRHTADSCIFPIEQDGVHEIQEPSRKAIGFFSELLGRTPPNTYFWVKARWLLNIAYMTLGEYPDGVPADYVIPAYAFSSDENVPRFVDVAPELGLNTFDLAGGAVAEDFTGDGWLDLVVTTSDTEGQMRLFVSDGAGGYVERTHEAGLDGLTGGLNLTHADYDNDGDYDLLVLRGAWWKNFGQHPNSLLRNNGDGSFTDVTFDAGLGEVHYPTQTAAWADYDNDGDLDLYIGNEKSADLDAPSQLFRNEGDGRFVDVAESLGVTNDRYAKAVAWADIDGDRDPDLYVSNIGEPNRMYRNNGAAGFEDVAEEMFVDGPLASFPIWFGDVDNDGSQDLFVGAYGGDRLPPDVSTVAAQYMGLMSNGDRHRIYHSDPRGRYFDVAPQMGITRVSLPMGCNRGDIDNDGHLDFYLGTGYPYYEGLVPNLMYRNVDGVAFADVTTAAGLGHLQKGHGVVFADLDNDGDQDIFEQMGGFYPGDAFGNALFRNPGFGNHWLKLRLVGTRSNRSGVGAHIQIAIDDAGTSRTVHRWVDSGGSFGGNPFRQEIGLGQAETIRKLEIYWPTSDTTQIFENVAVNAVYEVTEGSDQLRELAHPTIGE